MPFVDQMFNRLAGKGWYCFLDGHSRYNQISIDLEDQEKTTFTCPYGTFAFKGMPFRLCNASVTFQCCMMSIFSDLVEDTIEVFMDHLSLVGDSFDGCLDHLAEVLKRRFIKDFSKIAQALCQLLEKECMFDFDDAFLRGFGELKEKLVSAPIIN
ncbi:RNA-directed DNA polymerase homolog [Solanum tuberosum]|uniref:RNA-directed DNA polymerase homolog n=1 Tax=Solanum tuberosum TaxID=4113 RepID=UPI00073A2D36|nr:PREDICTED: RNA-directed DNA polymerase homolog [Solanum tuberosum]